MTKQKRKSCMSQFGELIVAAELNRRQFLTSITYGNLKSMDVVAFSEHGHYATIEVKTSDKKRFPTGLHTEKQASSKRNVFWVFVTTSLDPDKFDTNFYILSDEEIKKAQSLVDSKYVDGYVARHGKKPTGKGVPNVTLKDIDQHRNRWDKIENFLNTKQG